jgi:hypothetical protein
MPNITISIDENTYRAARVVAAAKGASVSSLVKEFLITLTEQDARIAALVEQEAAIREEISTFDAADRLPRDQLHRRGGE